MTKKIKMLSIALCGTAMLGLGSLAAANKKAANADTTLILPQEYAIETEYTYGEFFVVPDPSTVFIKTGALQKTAVSAVLEFPDGTAKSEGGYTLDKTGTYRLTYYDSNGIAATQSFVVNKNNYGLSDGTNATYVDGLFGIEGKQGIEVSLEDGASFTFNKSINLNDYAGQALEVCKIFPMFRTDENTDPDVSTVSVKIVDFYDETKFVEFLNN